MSMNEKIPSAPSPVAARPLRLRIDTQSEDVRIEVVPLVDVVFCILIFFILASVSFARQQAISIDLPKASTGTPQGREILVVSLNELGQVFVEQQPVVTKDQFKQKLRAYRKKNANGLMALYASTNTSYSEVVQVLDLMREEGGDRVALATLPGEPGSAPSSTPSVQQPATGVPGFSPNPGTNPYNPSGTPNPTGQFNPGQPQVPLNPGQQLPQSPGINPGTLQPLPGQPQLSPGNLGVPSPGVPAAPNSNNAVPGKLGVPSPGVPAAPNSNNAAPPKPGVPSPGVPAAPNSNNAAPRR